MNPPSKGCYAQAMMRIKEFKLLSKYLSLR